jgi:glycosyltransferase involved in cell wall biosynthesis
MKINIVVTAYNHEKYIAQCMESVLCQVGDFQMEVIVGDDASTDNTREILEGFQHSHPGVVSLLPAGPNLGVTGNLKRCLDACSGDFIAVCEGDDYWTDTHKLQRQMDCLQLHPDYSMCFSALRLYFQDTNTFVLNVLPERDFLQTEDLISRNYIANFSCCMYRESTVRRLPSGIFDMFIADWMFNIACSQLGTIGFIRDPLSVYRIHSRGAWSGMLPVQSLRETCRLIDHYNEFLGYRYDTLFTQHRRKLEDQILALELSPGAGAGTDTNTSGAHARQLVRALGSRALGLARRFWRLIPPGSHKERLSRVLAPIVRSREKS